ncbi:hypothetical protein RAA17_08385 [Komagataeibacter rhaeticus]|nr:hypothetical protein [Komagataeibacter rhaeticus]
MCMAATRAAYQRWRQAGPRTGRAGCPVIVLGSEADTTRFLKLMPAMAGRVVGMVVESRQRRPGRRVRGVPVLGQVTELRRIVSAMARDGDVLLVVADGRFRGAAFRCAADGAGYGCPRALHARPVGYCRGQAGPCIRSGWRICSTARPCCPMRRDWLACWGQARADYRGGWHDRQ